jgi:hypothetical protein
MCIHFCVYLECIPKNHSKSPFKVKTDVQKVLSRYDSFQSNFCSFFEMFHKIIVVIESLTVIF